MDLHQLRCFAIAVEEGGFKRATARLGMTQPALSYQIKQLEQDLGAALFHRRPRGVSPTEAGRVLYDHAREVMEAMRRARRAVEELHDGVLGQVRIGTVNSIGIYFLPQVLQDVREKHPTAHPTVLYRNSDEITEALLSDQIDLALIANPTPDRRLRQETIVEEQVSLVCGRTHPFFGKGTIKTSELQGVQFVSLASENPTGDLISKHLARLGVTVQQSVSTDNVETAKKMVEVGLGVAFLPDMVTSGEIVCEGGAMSALARVEVGQPLMRKISLVTWRNLDVTRAVGAFIEELREHGKSWKPCRP